VPGKGAAVRISGYATGGGTAGNVREGAIRTLKSSIPFVAAVDVGLVAARGDYAGADAYLRRIRGPDS